MKILLTAVSAVLLLSACGADEGASTASDPAGDAPSTPSAPAAVPGAPGTVHTRTLATVMDTGTPELCLGPVAESFPPQCTGPAITGWDWADHDGVFEREGDVTWGMFSVTGQWDGETFTYESAVPAALFDPMAEEPPAYPTPAVEHTEEELLAIQDELTATLPGVQSAYGDGERVLVDVTYDDGSLQEWVESEYGKDVVVINSLLVDEDA